MIYLRHPKHGTKIATLDLEAEYDMQNGWEEYDPREAVSAFETSDNYGNAMQGKRRGRPPRVAVQEA